MTGQAGAPVGALVCALLALGALPLLGQGTRRGERAANRPAPTTTTAARLLWLAIAGALGRWLAEGLLNLQMELMGVVWLAILPVVLVAAAGLAMVAQGLVRRRGWARWVARWRPGLAHECEPCRREHEHDRHGEASSATRQPACSAAVSCHSSMRAPTVGNACHLGHGPA